MQPATSEGSGGSGTAMTDKPPYPPAIELDGVRLRPLRVADAEALYAYLRDPIVTELTSYPVISRPMVEGMIERCLSRWAAGDLFQMGGHSSARRSAYRHLRF